MKLTISFKHLKHTPALDERIQQKSEHFEKFFQGNIHVQWFCWVQDNHHWAEVKIHGPKFDFFAKASADNMYKSLDLVVEKIERQFEKQKSLRRNKIHNDAHLSRKHLEIQKLIDDEEKEIERYWEEKSA
jgi:putative sigma-54 modulation protein